MVKRITDEFNEYLKNDAVFTNEKDARQAPGVVWFTNFADRPYHPGGRPTSGWLKSQTPEGKIMWSIPCSDGVGAQAP